MTSKQADIIPCHIKKLGDSAKPRGYPGYKTLLLWFQNLVTLVSKLGDPVLKTWLPVTLAWSPWLQKLVTLITKRRSPGYKTLLPGL